MKRTIIRRRWRRAQDHKGCSRGGEGWPGWLLTRAVSAFPHGARRSQLDLIPEDGGAFAKAAKAAGLKLSKKKSGFLIQGEDRPGAVAEVAEKLAQAANQCHVYTSLLHRCRSLRRYAVG